MFVFKYLYYKFICFEFVDGCNIFSDFIIGGIVFNVDYFVVFNILEWIDLEIYYQKVLKVFVIIFDIFGDFI